MSDQPALAAAIARGEPVIPLYVWAPEVEGDWPYGGAHRWWLHHALADLDRQLRAHGLRLILRQGSPAEVIRRVASETGAAAVFWNRRYEPAAIQHDAGLKEALRAEGLAVESFSASLLFEPWKIATQAGQPYRVYSPFARSLLALALPAPVEVEWKHARSPGRWPDSDALEALKLRPKVRWDRGMEAAWEPTRAGAERRLREFLDRIEAYPEARDQPALDGTSRLSPYLRWGQIGPRELVAALGSRRAERGGESFLREIVWREFGYHVLYHFPSTPTAPLQAHFRAFPWEPDEGVAEAWRRGRTGYPIVDAGLRQLWKAGWMHNRVRMIVGSLLVKHLLQPWQEGARWFWDTLVDGDLANNTLGWQWASGCGADAAPYFRIFNPMTQGSKFDPNGAYVRRWLPELARLPASCIHQPWEASDAELKAAGVRLGDSYPRPLIEHRAARARALEAFARVKERQAS